MQVNLTVKFSDATELDVTATAADLVAFETKFDLSVAKLEQNVKLTHLLFIAYNQQRRTGATKLEFEKWVETVESIEAAPAKK